MIAAKNKPVPQKIRGYAIAIGFGVVLMIASSIFISFHKSSLHLPKDALDSTPFGLTLGEPSVWAFDDGHGGDRIDEESRSEMLRRVELSIAQLQEQQILPQTFTAPPVLFDLPVRAAENTPGYASHTISNYFDHDPLFVDELQDYRCGEFTYDAADGYNHTGTDFMPFPFPWQKMDREEVYVVAAAAGVIVEKQDGRFDAECVAQPREGNTIILQHLDGTKSLYLHMKNGSLLTKSIGDSVAAGERLGVIGSSGRSNGPHLHFEVHDADGTVIDPFFDASNASCNTTATESWWTTQPLYNDSGINDIIISAEGPQFPACAKTILSEQTIFAPGGRVILNVFYRNDSIGNETAFGLYKPDGESAIQWTHSPTDAYASGAAWSFPIDLPENIPLGDWMFKATYDQRVYEKEFVVAASVPATAVPTATFTPVPTAASTVAPTATPVPATATSVPATATTVPATTVSATATTVPATATTVPATAIPTPVTPTTSTNPSDNMKLYLPAVLK